MKTWSVMTAGLALAAVVACKGGDTSAAASDDSLSKQLEMASNDGLALAPSTGSRTVVSAGELSPQARTRMSASDRVTRSAPHRTPHRDRAPRAAREVASVASAVPSRDASAAPASETASAGSSAAPAPADAPVEAPRPQPVDVSYPSSGSGRAGRSGGGIGIGDIIGVIGGVVLRGGVAGDDHCDPRSERRGRYPSGRYPTGPGGVPIPINPYAGTYQGRI